MASAATTMASAEQTTVPATSTTTLTPRKFKASDLPLPSATRSAIEGLAHSFKKKGGYDAIRKQIWEKFEQSDYEAQVTKSILEVAEQELERNPSQLLTLERRKAAALIDGALDRSGVYQKAEEVLDQLIDVEAIETRMRELRQAEIGLDAAKEEQERGSKTDIEYAIESARSLDERERIRRELRVKEEQILEEKRKIEREERKKRERERERELEKAEAKRKEERDARRREREKKEAEREREREKEREERRRARERDREKDHDRRRSRTRSRHRSRDRSRHRDRNREGDRDRDRDRSRRRDSRERRHRERSPRDERERGKPEELKKQLTKEDHERLEREALENLLRESKKSTAKQPELEVDEALVPPPRRIKPASAIQPIRRDSIKNSDTKRTPELTKSESKDSAKEAADGKEGRETKTSKESKEPEPKETKENKESKEPKDTKSKEERRPSPAPSRHHRDRSRGTEDDRRRRDRDHQSIDQTVENVAVLEIVTGLWREIGIFTVQANETEVALVRDLSATDMRGVALEIDTNPTVESEVVLGGPGTIETDVTGVAHVPALRNGMIAEKGRAHLSPESKNLGRVRPEADPVLGQLLLKREQEAKAYLAAQRAAREKGLPIPGVDDKWSTGERSPEAKRARAPDEIDRYRPGDRDRTDKYRERDRDDRRDKEKERDKDDRRERRRSRSKSRSRRQDRDRSRDRDKSQDRERHRSRDRYRGEGTRDRDRDHDRDRDKYRERDRDRDGDRDKRSRRDRSNESRRDKGRDRRDRSIESRRDKRDQSRSRRRSRSPR
ncbi:arginine rich protein [Daldinia childiae]|uniref:arginine rich protein n=1 Tax=Daldinia childiae TaxID=326645 RepID=UPI001445DF82|nr:arginine rich protein [Daldinia childiae]KAF3064685.1 arginine rich protein [Daldinia childiae]